MVNQGSYRTRRPWDPSLMSIPVSSCSPSSDSHRDLDVVVGISAWDICSPIDAHSSSCQNPSREEDLILTSLPLLPCWHFDRPTTHNRDHILLPSTSPTNIIKHARVFIQFTLIHVHQWYPQHLRYFLLSFPVLIDAHSPRTSPRFLQIYTRTNFYHSFHPRHVLFITIAYSNKIARFGLHHDGRLFKLSYWIPVQSIYLDLPKAHIRPSKSAWLAFSVDSLFCLCDDVCRINLNAPTLCLLCVSTPSRLKTTANAIASTYSLSRFRFFFYYKPSFKLAT